jgi:hypothetical protein
LRNQHGAALLFEVTRLNGGVFLCDGFRAEGEVRLNEASVGRNLDCSSGTFKSLGEMPALSASGTKVEGSVVLEEGFAAEGEVNVTGARIGGDVLCRGALFKNAGKTALRATESLWLAL